MKKFELTSEFITNIFGTKLFRIKALIEFGNVKAGELGGFVEKEENLSQDGNAWVYDSARVYLLCIPVHRMAVTANRYHKTIFLCFLTVTSKYKMVLLVCRSAAKDAIIHVFCNLSFFLCHPTQLPTIHLARLVL